MPDAGTNVTNMINGIFAQSPGATVILTTILVNSVAEQDACRVTVNSQVSYLGEFSGFEAFINEIAYVLLSTPSLRARCKLLGPN